MSCTLRQLENQHWLLEGEIDFHSVIALRDAGEALLREADQALQFDFSGVRQTNTAALSLLLCWSRLAQQRGLTVGFHRLPAELHSMAAVSELESLFE